MKEILLELKKYILENKENLSRREIIDLIDNYNLSIMDKYELIDSIEDNEKNYYSQNDFKNYLIEIAKYPTLSLEELKELYLKKLNGDKKAREIIIKCNLKFVVTIVKKYLKFDFSPMDLVQEGNIGLIKAVDKFDPSKGYKFSTYAAFWIKNYVVRFINNKTVKIDERVLNRIKYLFNYEEELIKELGRYPTDKELCDYYNDRNSNHIIKEEDVQKMKNYNRIPVSLNDTITGKESDNTEIIDFINIENEDVSIEVERNILYKNIRGILEGNIKSNLTEQEKGILLLRFGFNGNPHTLEEIASIYGVTRERIRQLEGRALRKIKTYKKTKNAIY